MPLLPFVLALTVAVADPPIHHGRSGSTAVQPPRAAASITVDGVLDEPVWRDAAVLTGFSQFSPQDGIASADSTEGLVW
jgi:hypothetical protein